MALNILASALKFLMNVRYGKVEENHRTDRPCVLFFRKTKKKVPIRPTLWVTLLWGGHTYTCLRAFRKTNALPLIEALIEEKTAGIRVFINYGGPVEMAKPRRTRWPNSWTCPNLSGCSRVGHSKKKRPFSCHSRNFGCNIIFFAEGLATIGCDIGSMPRKENTKETHRTPTRP